MPPGPIWDPFGPMFSISALVGNFVLLVGSVGCLVALLGWFSHVIGAVVGLVGWSWAAWLNWLVGLMG